MPAYLPAARHAGQVSGHHAEASTCAPCSWPRRTQPCPGHARTATRWAADAAGSSAIHPNDARRPLSRHKNHPGPRKTRLTPATPAGETWASGFARIDRIDTPPRHRDRRRIVPPRGRPSDHERRRRTTKRHPRAYGTTMPTRRQTMRNPVRAVCLAAVPSRPRFAGLHAHPRREHFHRHRRHRRGVLPHRRRHRGPCSPRKSSAWKPPRKSPAARSTT